MARSFQLHHHTAEFIKRGFGSKLRRKGGDGQGREGSDTQRGLLPGYFLLLYNAFGALEKSPGAWSGAFRVGIVARKLIDRLKQSGWVRVVDIISRRDYCSVFASSSFRIFAEPGQRKMAFGFFRWVPPGCRSGIAG